MRKVAIAALALALSGCAYFPDVTDRMAVRAGNLVNKYCDTLTPEDRQLFGDKVRSEASPDSITVTCE